MGRKAAERQAETGFVLGARAFKVPCIQYGVFSNRL